jgi:hypothetical protein
MKQLVIFILALTIASAVAAQNKYIEVGTYKKSTIYAFPEEKTQILVIEKKHKIRFLVVYTPLPPREGINSDGVSEQEIVHAISGLAMNEYFAQNQALKKKYTVNNREKCLKEISIRM